MPGKVSLQFLEFTIANYSFNIVIIAAIITTIIIVSRHLIFRKPLFFIKVLSIFSKKDFLGFYTFFKQFPSFFEFRQTIYSYIHLFPSPVQGYRWGFFSPFSFI